MIDIGQIPEGMSGDWKIETFEVPENSIENIRAMFKPGCRIVTPGKYKRLMRNGSLVMSNTPDEFRDFSFFVHRAKGNVLINGLGMGCVVAGILNREKTESITVVEISKDLINLVSPFFEGKTNGTKLEIINADAFKFKPPRGIRYDAVWHDIWDDICVDNLKEMATLHRKYGRRTDYQASWCKELCLRYRGC